MQDSRVLDRRPGRRGRLRRMGCRAHEELGQPDKDELAKIQQFVDGVLVRAACNSRMERMPLGCARLFYFNPIRCPRIIIARPQLEKLDEVGTRQASELGELDLLNYPHVAAAYWVLYRLARDHQSW